MTHPQAGPAHGLIFETVKARRSKKGLKGSIDDVLGNLLADDDLSPPKALKASSSTSVPIVRPRSNILSNINKKSPLDETFFSQLAKEAAEDSDVSEADAQALLESLKDLDDMDAEIFGSRKPKSAPAKNSGISQSTDIDLKPGEKRLGALRGHSAPESEKKPSSAPVGPSRPYKKFSFDEDAENFQAPPDNKDVVDPLAGLLSDEDDGITKKPKTTDHITSLHPSPKKTADARYSSPVQPSPAPQRKDQLSFEDDTYIMDNLRDSPQGPKKEESTVPRPARSKLDEVMGRGTSAKLLERPLTGEKREFKLDPKYQKQSEKEDILANEDIAFGSYQPTVIFSPEGRSSRRSSVRFSAESNDNLKANIKSQPATPRNPSPARVDRGGADWLGLKDEDIPDAISSPPVREPTRSSTLTPNSTGLPHSGTKSGNGPTTQPTESQPQTGNVQQKDEWLTTALSRKKAEKQENIDEKIKAQNNSVLAEPAGSSAPAMSASATQKSNITKISKDKALDVSVSPLPWEGPQKSSAPSAVPTSRREEKAPSLVPQEHLTAEMEQPSPVRHIQKSIRESEREHEALLELRNRTLDLEAQVRKLQMEKEQQNLLLETLQQRHKEDLELIESAHRNRLKLLDDSARQREERLCQENKELSAQYLSHSQNTEREKAEMLAQYQRKLTEFQQEKEIEVERIRELQRTSVKEMCRDHEEQLQRLKRLKDQEIDAVTSASSQTRSLNGVIEQMESFTHKLSDLSEKVENTQMNTSQELELGARQREGQLKALQERLSRQQKDMEEERNSLRMIITNMETRLIEQSRLLEQEHWTVSAEQAKVESLQRSLEEQRRVLTQQMAMERAELDRAKSALLEEQQSVMKRCAEERRKLAAEWSEFHTQQKLSKERVEKEVNRALMVETQREGAIVSLAKEQAELKVQAGELRNREEQLALAKEALEKERQELRLEKERVNASALRVRQRAEEIESMSKLATQQYEEGEKALAKAKKVESEHHCRLKTIQQKIDWLRQQEERFHQERLNLANQRRQLDKLCQRLPTAPALYPAGLAGPQLAPQQPGFPGHHGNSYNVSHMAAGHTEMERESGAIQVKLARFRISARQDRDFLEDEQLFLENLKKSNNSRTQAVCWEERG
ncbi:fas-binding factor 1 [Pelodytes ibericus]